MMAIKLYSAPNTDTTVTDAVARTPTPLKVTILACACCMAALLKCYPFSLKIQK